MNALFIFSTIFSANKFLHITDIHYDPLYTTDSPTKCVLGSTGLGCCHQYDIPLKNSNPANRWGNYDCDTPYTLIDGTLQWIHDNFYNTENSIDFIIYTGDSASHHDFSNTPSVVKTSISNINSLFQQYFPKIPIYNNLGNHDTWPIDQTTPIEYNKLLEFIANLWNTDINDITSINIQKGGYYSLDLNNSTKLISFNSIFYDGHNLFKHKNLQTDAQIIWLRSILDKARLNRQTIWFISHIFPTAGESTNEYNTIIKQIMWDYRDIIKYQWWGHSHNDQFILYQNTDSNTNQITSFSAGMVSPSIMPDKRFPAFRIYDYNSSTFDLIDYTQYYCNLTDVIIKDKMSYSKQYSFKELYHLDGLETEHFDQLYNGIINGTYTDLYCKQYTPGHNSCNTNNIIV